MRNMHRWVETLSTAAIALVAVAVGFTFFQDRRAGTGISGDAFESARTIPDWEIENDRGIRLGPENAQVVITEFMDFECPFCAHLALQLDSVVRAHPDDVAVVFQHFPLRSHGFAIPAAIAAECADRQDQFWPMYRSLLAGQKAFGTVDWSSFAEQSGVPDRERFANCVVLPMDSFPRISDGIALGQRTGVNATPTTWVNGRVMRPTDEILSRLLK
jgi:protein-disulfide isomerase